MIRKALGSAAVLVAALFLHVPMAHASDPATACAGHPRNAAGFVTDGSPQCGPQWCVGPNPGRFACLVAIYPGLPGFLNAQWAATHVQAVSFDGPANGVEACIVQNEDRSGDPQAWNGGHWGLFQFSRDTWVRYGNPPSQWGNAGAAAQWAAFHHTVAQEPWPYSDWRPYDSC